MNIRILHFDFSNTHKRPRPKSRSKTPTVEAPVKLPDQSDVLAKYDIIKEFEFDPGIYSEMHAFFALILMFFFFRS